MKTNPVKFLLGAALLGVSASLFGQNLILNGQTIELDPDADVSINPVTGNITVFAADPDLTCGSSPLPVITSFDVVPTTVQQGGSVSVSWASTDATSCLSQGTLPGWGGVNRPTSGSADVPISAGQATGDYTAGMRCSNSEGDDQVNPVTVTVEPGGGGSCSTKPPPAGILQHSSLFFGSSNPTTHWSHVYGGGSDFPVSSGNSAVLSIPNARYGSLAFSSDALLVGQSGQLIFNDHSFPSNHRKAAPLVVVSECPGDFGPQPDSRCRAIPSFGIMGFRWHEASTLSSGSSKCPIERNKDLYLNMVPSSVIPSGQNLTWRCDGSTSISFCGFITSAQ